MKYVPPIGAADPNDPYIDGNPGTGTEGSPVPAAAIEHSMREIIKVITEAGLTPDEENLTQLHEAIQVLINANVAPDASTTVKGVVELADGAEALGGADTTRAVTAAALASAKSYVSNGYQKLPGGLILQWGRFTPTATTGTVTFPVSFPNNAFGVQLTRQGGTADLVEVDAADISTSGFPWWMVDPDYGWTSGFRVYWFAIGN